MHPLSPLGWSSSFEDAFETFLLADPGLRPARVSQAHRESLRILLAPGEERVARTGGRLLHGAASPADLPAVGDFVAVELPPGGGDAVVRAVLPRRGALLRREPERSVAVQVLAANVDTVLAAFAVDRPLRPRLLDRLLALAWDGGANPVVVLAKIDLVPDPGARVREAEAACPGAPVVAVSAATGAGMEALAALLRPGTTAALLGPSGAGKSTLANRLLGEERMATGGVRDLDARGRHTTVHRHLLPLPGGAVLIDTPGLREVALLGGGEGLDAAFPDIAALAERCRFRDCGHGSEPGCAVLAAAAAGSLDPSRLESWRKLGREEAHLARKLGLEAPWAARGRRRAWGRMVREAVEKKRRMRGGE